MGAALDSHAQPAASPLLGLALHVALSGRGEVLQAEQQATPLLQTPLLLSLPLGEGDRNRERKNKCGESNFMCRMVIYASGLQGAFKFVPAAPVNLFLNSRLVFPFNSQDFKMNTIAAVWRLHV